MNGDQSAFTADKFAPDSPHPSLAVTLPHNIVIDVACVALETDLVVVGLYLWSFQSFSDRIKSVSPQTAQLELLFSLATKFVETEVLRGT